MQDPLQRITKLQTIIAAILVAGLGIALMVLGAQTPTNPNLAWLRFFPWSEVGGTLLVAGLLGLGIDYFTGRDREARDTARLQHVLAESAPAMRDAVIQGFAFGNDDLARVASPDTLDDIIQNSLALRLGDKAFAEEVYQDIRDQAIQASERWHDAKVEIRLSPAAGGSAEAPAAPALFTVTVRWEYSVVPRHRSRRFAAVSDKAEYAELAREDGTFAWYVTPKAGLNATDREAFELVQFSVDGQERAIRQASRKTGQIYTVDLSLDARQAEEPVTIAYTYRTVTERRGHLLYIDIEQPTRGIEVELDYSDCAIERVSVLDFIASSKATRIERSPDTVPGKSVRVGFDGWVFPRSGVGFVWVTAESAASAPTTNGKPR
ncbi:hypothetical protein H0264_35705 [Nocardia huaxiensis]|uniref:Uncharacterized protein n=1 Tax=Nocardia huaxiensis TaxID=2755382 RepID=A0A7D6VIL9_9NOCA|nr:hypothetical protein [Nocardia huaxiensis]QLY30410.1 hypothetical protein H0264_35705 [Nocardia huaxiensis]